MNKKQLISLWVVGIAYVLFIAFHEPAFGSAISDVEGLIICTVPFLVIVGLLWLTLADKRS